MITENITINAGDMNYRDITGFYFAKWFDEPFTVEILNRLHYNNRTYCLAERNDDRSHRDFYYIDEDNKKHYADCKTHIHNFVYKRTKEFSKTADVVTIGNYALNSMTEFITVVYKSRIYIINHIDIMNVKPLSEQMSSGQNNRSQLLTHYDMQSLIEIPFTQSVVIPSNLWFLYQKAYDLFLKYKSSIYDYFRCQKPTQMQHLMYSVPMMEQFKSELIPIIREINSTYTEIPLSDSFSSDLADIYSLLS